MIAAAHTVLCLKVVGWGSRHGSAKTEDSPCLKLRPCSKMPSSAGMLQIGVDTYGGGGEIRSA